MKERDKNRARSFDFAREMVYNTGMVAAGLVSCGDGTTQKDGIIL